MTQLLDSAALRRGLGTLVALLCLAGPGIARGQDDPLAETPEEEEVPAEVDIIPAGELWDTTFGLSFRGGVWVPLQVEVKNEPKINDATDNSGGFDVGLRWYSSERITVFGRYFRGGLKFDEKEIGQFDGIDPALTTDSFLETSGFEFGVHVALTSLRNSGSYLRPYLTFGAGFMDWAVSQDGRGGEPHSIEAETLDGSDLHGVFGGGLDFPLGKRVWLELDWTWRFFFTSDGQKYTLDTARWGMTHAWQLGPGLVLRF